MNNKRVPGTIVSVFYGKEDHGILTMSLAIDMPKHGYQHFGGVCLSEEIGPDFVKSVCDVFDVRDPERLKGKDCFALYAFDENNETICGLEAPSGKRFIINAWRKKHFPETTSVFDQKVKSIVSEIAFLERRISQERTRLVKLEENYTEWETE